MTRCQILLYLDRRSKRLRFENGDPKKNAADPEDAKALRYKADSMEKVMAFMG